MNTKESKQPATCSVWPLFWFEPKLRKGRYDFAHGVSLYKITPQDARALAEAAAWAWVCTGPPGDTEYEASEFSWDDCPIMWDTPLPYAEDEWHWALCVKTLPFQQEIPPQEAGVDLRLELEADFARHFLDSMRIVGGKAILAPVRFEGSLTSNRPGYDRMNAVGQVLGLLSGAGTWASSPEFAEEDLKVLALVWKRIAKLSGLLGWRQRLRDQEEFLEEFWNTGVLAGKGELATWARVLEEKYGVLMSLEEVQVIVKAIEERLGKSPRQVPETVSAHRDERRELFVRKFQEVRRRSEERALCETRIGRAVSFFLSSTDLPLAHRLVSMCTVLELLLKTEYVEEGIGEYVGQRAQKLLGGGCDPEGEHAKQTEQCYRKRNAIIHGPVHGYHWIHTVLAESLARKSILTVLSDRKLFDLFRGPDDAVRHYLADC